MNRYTFVYTSTFPLRKRGKGRPFFNLNIDAVNLDTALDVWFGNPGHRLAKLVRVDGDGQTWSAL